MSGGAEEGWADDDYGPDEPDEDDDENGSECGAFINGKFGYYFCTMAGTEYCDWDCPFADEGRRARIRAMKREAK